MQSSIYIYDVRIVFIILYFLVVPAYIISAQETRTYVGQEHFFKLTITKDSTSTDCSVLSIDVFRNGDSMLIQKIIPRENWFYCDGGQEYLFFIEDMNFDGTEDIRMMQFLPASPNIPYYYWIFDIKENQYVADTTLEIITSPQFSKQDQSIYSSWRANCCDHGMSTYKYINGLITLVKEAEIYDDPEHSDQTIFTERKLINGKMQFVKRKVEKKEMEDK